MYVLLQIKPGTLCFLGKQSIHCVTELYPQLQHLSIPETSIYLSGESCHLLPNQKQQLFGVIVTG